MLPTVSVQAAAGEPPVVTVNGSPIAGVRSAQVTVTQDGIPHVTLMLHASVVDVELPAGVYVVQAGPSAADFAEQLNPARLEGLALQQQEAADVSMGEAFAAAVTIMADEYAHNRRG